MARLQIEAANLMLDREMDRTPEIDELRAKLRRYQAFLEVHEELKDTDTEILSNATFTVSQG